MDNKQLNFSRNTILLMASKTTIKLIFMDC